MIKNLFLFYIVFGSCSALFGQSLSSKVVASAGGFSSGSSGSLSYTIGETSIQTFKTTNNILTEGFQQGTSLDPGSSVVNLVAENINIQLFPNPATSYIEFSINAPVNTVVGITIYNILGEKICDVSDISTNGFGYSAVHGVSDLADGVYFAAVSINGQTGHSKQYISKSFIINK